MVFLIIILLILLNGYFSLAEIALVAVRKDQLSDAEKQGRPNAIKALELATHPEEFLSAVQVGITLLGILEGIYGGNLVASRLEPWLIHMGMASLLSHIISLVIGIGAITYLTIIFGELVPKSIALQMPLKTALAVAPSLVFFINITYPFIRILTASTHFLLNLFSIRTQGNEKITENDLKRMLGEAYKQGLLDEPELYMHQNIFAFADLTAVRIMKPARIVHSLSSDWDREKVETSIRQFPYSYFPVYQGTNTGQITGVLRTKDFYIHADGDWHRHINLRCFIPTDMKALQIFSLFKRVKMDFGVVIDAGGKFKGIVTMQDIMEGVFGDIPELEDFRRYFFQLSPATWQAEGFIHLQRIRHTLKLEWLRTYEEHYISVEELMKGELHHMPGAGEQLKLHGITFTVTEVQDDEVIKVIIGLPPSR